MNEEEPRIDDAVEKAHAKRGCVESRPAHDRSGAELMRSILVVW
jgi:hypothetical protein